MCGEWGTDSRRGWARKSPPGGGLGFGYPNGDQNGQSKSANSMAFVNTSKNTKLASKYLISFSFRVSEGNEARHNLQLTVEEGINFDIF